MYSKFAWNKYNYHWTSTMDGWCNYTYHWCDGDYEHGRYDREV
jgi:hypothetical protein